MREIKFRAWNDSQKVMINWDTIVESKSLQELIELEHIVVMQYTGLQDSKGVDIYEGDCLMMFDGEYLATSKFIRGAFRFIGNGLPYSYYREHCEVVGNINSNPELLQ